MRLFAESDKLNKASLEHVRETNAWLEIHTQKTDEWSFLLLKQGRDWEEEKEEMIEGRRGALRDSTNQWRCGCYYYLSSNYLLEKSACRQLTIPDSVDPQWENANSENPDEKCALELRYKKA